MLQRYTREKMGKIFPDTNRFHYWLVIEIAVLKARHLLGELPHEVPDNLIDSITINPEEINRIEKEVTKHDVVAFLKHVQPQFPKELQSWVHRDMTSYDIGDTALSLQMRDALDLLIIEHDKLIHVLEARAIEFKNTAQVGRTHGIHAEPITFGIKLLNYCAEVKRSRRRLMHLRREEIYGKLSGAVGVYTLSPEIEEVVCSGLGLKSIIATQIISRDIIAEHMLALSIAGATLAKIATEIRNLSRTEIGEVAEAFGRGQKGSSAMPHKQNPIGSENIVSLMRPVCTNGQVALENLSTCWHERSLDNSGNERIIIADTFIALDFSLARLTDIIENLRVFPDRMMENLNLTKGLVFSQTVMTLVADKSGLPREDAHALVGAVAQKCREERSGFLEALLKSEEIMKYVSEEEMLLCFDLDYQLRHVDDIFQKELTK